MWLRSIFRKKCNKIIVLMGTLMFVLMFSQIAFAYKWAATNTTYPKYRVYVDYTSLSSSLRTAVYNGRMEWNNTGNSQCYFYYDTSGINRFFEGNYGITNWVGLTSTSGTPNINWAQTQINDDNIWTVDSQAVMTHELGHWLRLGESANPVDTMFPVAFSYQCTLASNDIAGIQSLYGRHN